MEIAAIVERLQEDTACVHQPPAGLPVVPDPLRLPRDLVEFYSMVGGATLFSGRDYQVEIVPPSELLRANPIIVGEPWPDDISYHWFIIARLERTQFLTIDLDPSRLGRCYDSFWDSHAVRGACATIALSFTELLRELLDARGAYWYWLRERFRSIVDAYD